MYRRERPPTDLELSHLTLVVARCFVLRWDVYATQQPDGSYRAVQELLNANHLLEHLKGRSTLGTYLLNKHSQGRYLVFDADTDEQWERLTAMGERLYQAGVPSYLEESRRGGHQWLFLPVTMSGEKIRRFAHGLLAAHEIEGIEIYPKQDKLSGGPGSLIRLPFGIHQKSGKRYGFYRPTGELLAPTIHEQIERLRAPQTVPLPAIDSYSQLAASEPKIEESAGAEKPSELRVTAELDAPLSERLKAAITMRAFVERFAPEVQLNKQGRGFCPFHEDSVRSFGVDEERNFWHCFAGCGGGSIIDFWMQWRGREGLDTSFTATITDLADRLL